MLNFSAGGSLVDISSRLKRRPGPVVVKSTAASITVALATGRRPAALRLVLHVHYYPYTISFRAVQVLNRLLKMDIMHVLPADTGVDNNY
jgi:hypothetical protein